MSQSEAILAHLKDGGSLTKLDALRLYDCMNLGQRILELRQQGFPIETEMISTPTKKRIALYTLPGPSEC